MPSFGQNMVAGGAQAALGGAPNTLSSVMGGLPQLAAPQVGGGLGAPQRPQLGFFDRIANDPMRMMMFTDILRGAGRGGMGRDGIGGGASGVGGFKGFSDQGASAFQNLISQHGAPAGGFAGLIDWLGTAGAPPVTATSMTPPPVGSTNFPAPGVAGGQPLSAVAALNSPVGPQANPIAQLGFQADEALARLGNLGGGIG